MNGKACASVSVDVYLDDVLDSMTQKELMELCSGLIDDGYGPESGVSNDDAISRQLYRMKVLGLDLEKTSIETLEELLGV